MGPDSETLSREYFAYVSKGGCMEQMVGVAYCTDEAEEKNEDAFTKCKEAKKRRDECFDAHSDHYRVFGSVLEPVLDLVGNKIDDDVIAERRFNEFMEGTTLGKPCPKQD